MSEVASAGHPKGIPPDRLTITNEIENSIVITASTVTSSNKCSAVYLTCRNSNIEEVKRLLKTIKLDEMDRIEPNGSTTLHVACFHSHQEIVKLLLEAAADRAISNKYNCLSFDEGKNNETNNLSFVYRLAIDSYQPRVPSNEN
ncbi:unnamed protein product [Rotaria sordida]|uniref:Uncharacterized protein n=1 Tax=Rotaria sordida TaxID=392033 RepID=A0A814UXR3_9BILA|nr:unnamed protein product [Rotaria sordida]CAF1231300.1 unnamed protein product [Rotaria sordida]CAF1254050.1 unnamed protein product [Rotaria sordida]CAF1260322.1 unnamed protein product [Rotaria sordida]CAF1513242.1 unnamed protein product [Rotaria sordida]